MHPSGPRRNSSNNKENPPDGSSWGHATTVQFNSPDGAMAAIGLVYTALIISERQRRPATSLLASGEAHAELCVSPGNT